MLQVTKLLNSKGPTEGPFFIYRTWKSMAIGE